MEKIFLFQIPKETEEFIRKIAGQMGVKIVVVAENLCNNTLGDIVNGKGKQDENAKFFGGSLMLFADVAEKHFDRMLVELRQKSVTVDYKAVLTPTNSGWTYGKFCMELVKEKMAFQGLRK